MTLISMLVFFNCSTNLDREIVDNEENIKEEEVEEEGLVINEDDFYIAPTSFVVSKNLKTDYSVDNDFDTNDSENLQNAIDFISDNGGGKLTIPAGNYSFAEVFLKSNVHLEIDANAIIRPAEIESKRNRNYAIFKVTNDASSTLVENVSICGVNGNFVVDLRETATDFLNIRIIQSYNVSNFKYSNITVQDNFSKFSTLEFNGVKIGDRVYGPRKGVIKNIDLYNSDYGYGVVQLQLAKELLFKNLYGQGGATLRIETHNKVLRELGTYDLVDEIYGRDIRSENGNSAVMLSPHFIDQGKVDIRGITSIGSGFAVRINKGFASPEEAEEGLGAGSFSSSSIIRDVSASFSIDKAQIKPKHYNYMPCSLREHISSEPISDFPHGDSYNGPSIAAVLYTPNYTIDIREKDISTVGFSDGLEIVTDEDLKNDNECSL
ncbi:hypothetical protein FHR24_001277 [Wenyingzhuangia heitensis]|uniref:Pectate lyase superfamily protein n=1 Tax=Wenyingzhuangia heitensis TaxID=1487859 RepID=A0ABX0U9E6_9FLAO|nr:hypothetical protein [Wenyingzhuangia heitensis]NIJ44838.1 hypothetical protein [Wenyingzhuangia heitensis]